MTSQPAKMVYEISTVRRSLWWLALVDFFVHGGIDRAKAWTSRRLNVKQSDAVWWWVFGADQLLHHLTHLAFIVLMVEM